MKQLCYFLVFRRPIGHHRKIKWDSPTGGLVMMPDHIVLGIPVADFEIATELIELRYHCGPHEELVIAEVFGRKECKMAWKLHNQWEREMSEFAELMNCS